MSTTKYAIMYRDEPEQRPIIGAITYNQRVANLWLRDTKSVSADREAWIETIVFED